MPNCDPEFQNDQFDLIESAYPVTASINMRNTSAAMTAARRDLFVADAIFCGSTFVASTLEYRGVPSEKLRVVPYGVASERFWPDEGRRLNALPLDVISVGTITPHKGILDVLLASKRLQPHLATFTLIGAAPHGLEWVDLGSARYVGRLTREQVADRMRRADVMILASWFEGLPLAVLEALSSGLPCVVTNRGADEAVRDEIEGIVVAPGDPDAIEAAIRRLADNPAQLAQMREAARSRAEQLTWDAYSVAAVDSLRVLYQSKSPLAERTQ